MNHYLIVQVSCDTVEQAAEVLATGLTRDAEHDFEYSIQMLDCKPFEHLAEAARLLGEVMLNDQAFTLVFKQHFLPAQWRDDALLLSTRLSMMLETLGLKDPG